MSPLAQQIHRHLSNHKSTCPYDLLELKTIFNRSVKDIVKAMQELTDCQSVTDTGDGWRWLADLPEEGTLF